MSVWNQFGNLFSRTAAPAAAADGKQTAAAGKEQKNPPPPLVVTKAHPTNPAVAAPTAGAGTSSAKPVSTAAPGDVKASPAGTGGAATAVVPKSTSNARYLHKLKDYALLMEFRLLKQRAPSGVYVIPSVETLRRWHGVIMLRHGFYRRGIFKFVIHIPEAYPYAAPRVYFLSKVFNPHINYKTGELDLTPQFPVWRSNEHYLELLLIYIKKIFYRAECWMLQPTAATAATAATNDAAAANSTATATTTDTAAALVTSVLPATSSSTHSHLSIATPSVGGAASAHSAPAGTSAAVLPIALPAFPPNSPIAVRGLHAAPLSPPQTPAAVAAGPIGTLPPGFQCYNKDAFNLWQTNKREFLNCCEDTVRWSGASKLLYDNRFDVASLNATISAAVPAEAKRSTQLLLQRQHERQAAAAAAAAAANGSDTDSSAAASSSAAFGLDDDDDQCIGLPTNPIAALRFTPPQPAHQQILERLLAPKQAALAGEEPTSYIRWFLDGVERLDAGTSK